MKKLDKRPYSKTFHKRIANAKLAKNAIRGTADKKLWIIFLRSGYGSKTLKVLLKILADKFLG